MATPTVIIITGHPANGKTTLAKVLADALAIPYFHKDGGKEIMMDGFGKKDLAWSRQIGRVSFELLYHQCDMLLKANVSHIIEANFNPTYADEAWQRLQHHYRFNAIQLLCQTSPAIALQRHQQRIADGIRHHGHIFGDELLGLEERLLEPIGWINIDGERIEVDTTPPLENYLPNLVTQLKSVL